MSMATFIRFFGIIFVLVFVTSGLVSYIYSLIVHGAGVADWESSFRFAIILGVALPLIEKFKETKRR